MELLYANTKLVALGILVLQNCSLILLLRYSRIEGDISTRYTSSTAVLTSEFLKFLLSLIFVYYENFRRNISISQSNYDIFIASRIEILKISIPAGLYVVQNNLQYISASNLPASIFQVLSQLKIVTTAIFSVLMLSKKLSFQQWAAVVALTCGVALVQYSNTSDSSLDSASVTLGLLCITLSCVTSGFAGVYFEKVLKSGSTSLWLRNIHLSAVGMVLSVAVCALSDGEVISRRGFFAGYTVTTWSVIVLQAGGGLVRRGCIQACTAFLHVCEHAVIALHT